MARPRRPGLSGEGGFTLPEVMIVIVLMGILFAIATSTWLRVVESRAVDSATNQMVSDLRLAHTSATNRLAAWQVALTPGSSSYQIGPSGGTPETRTLPEGTKVAGGISSIQFTPDGSAQLSGTGNVVVAADDDFPSNQIEVNTVTSRIRVVVD